MCLHPFSFSQLSGHTIPISFFNFETGMVCHVCWNLKKMQLAMSQYQMLNSLILVWFVPCTCLEFITPNPPLLRGILYLKGDRAVQMCTPLGHPHWLFAICHYATPAATPEGRLFFYSSSKVTESQGMAKVWLQRCRENLSLS